MGQQSINATFGIKNGGAVYSAPQTQVTIIAAPTIIGQRIILDSIVFSSDAPGSIKIQDNLNGNRVDIVRQKWFGAYGGIALDDMLKAARPNASVEITTTGTGNSTIDFNYHTKGGSP